MHLKTSFENIKRAPFQALAAISVLAVTFFVTTLVVIVGYSSSQILVYFETRPQVIAFIKDDSSQEQVDALKSKLDNDSRVNSVTYVSKEQALSIYKDATSENPLLGELVSPSSLPASIEFSPKSLDFAEVLIDEMRADSAIDSVGFTASIGGENAVNDVISRLKTFSLYIRVGGLIAVSVLSITSFLVLMIVIGMRILMKKDEIESLSLIGATPGFIRAPLVLEAINYAFIGVFIGWLFASVLVMYASPAIYKYFGEIPVLPANSLDFFMILGLILLGELLVGSVIALIGSFVSVSRSLKIQ